MKIDRNHMMKVAVELGLDIKFDSENAGVINSSTGEHKSWEKVGKEMWEFLGLEDIEKE